MVCVLEPFETVFSPIYIEKQIALSQLSVVIAEEIFKKHFNIFFWILSIDLAQSIKQLRFRKAILNFVDAMHTNLSDSPSHLETKSEEETEKNVELFASVATALAK